MARECLTLVAPRCIVIALALLVPPVAAADWPQWGGPDRNFVITDRTPLATSWPDSGPPVRWTVPIGPGNSGVVVRGGVVYTAFRAGDEDVVIALDAATGIEQWRARDRAPARDFMELEYGLGPHATPLVTTASVIQAGSTGHLVALDRATGTRRWIVRLWDDLEGTKVERGYAASPIAYDDTIIVPVGGPGRSVVAFRERDGSIVWARHDFPSAYASPVWLDVQGRRQLCLLLEKALIGLDPANGDLLWQMPIDDRRFVHCTTPVVGPGPCVVVNVEAGCRMFDIAAGEDGAYVVLPRWTSNRIGAQEHNMIRVGSRLIGANESATMAVLDLESGGAQIRTRSLADANVLLVNDHLLSLSEEGLLAISTVSEATIEVLARAQVLTGRVWAAPAFSEGTLFARDATRIVALDLAAR